MYILHEKSGGQKLDIPNPNLMKLEWKITVHTEDHELLHNSIQYTILDLQQSSLIIYMQKKIE